MLIFFLTVDGSLLTSTSSEWTQKLNDNSRSCKAKCHCTSEGPSTSSCEEYIADVGNNASKVVMDAEDSSDDVFILNTNSLCRELQECLAETIIMMECHGGDSYTGKKFNNEKDEMKNNSSGRVRHMCESDGAKSLAVDDCDKYVILEGFK